MLGTLSSELHSHVQDEPSVFAAPCVHRESHCTWVLPPTRDDSSACACDRLPLGAQVMSNFRGTVRRWQRGSPHQNQRWAQSGLWPRTTLGANALVAEEALSLNQAAPCVVDQLLIPWCWHERRSMTKWHTILKAAHAERIRVWCMMNGIDFET